MNKYILNLYVVTISLAFFLALPVLMDQLTLKQLGVEIGVRAAYAGDIYVDTDSITPPGATNNAAPAGIVKYAWSRLAGREDMVYLQLPSNQGSSRITLPDEPSGVIMAKYDPANNIGSLALMHMAQVGPTIKAEIIQLTPSNFHHFMGKHYYNFAWLDFNTSTAGCDSSKYLSSVTSPQVNNPQIMQGFTAYDAGQTLMPPSFSFTSAQQAQINASNLYWHQRLNNSSCFTPVNFKQFDDGSGNWTNMSQSGFFNLVSFAQQVHKCALSITAIANIQSQVSQSSHSSFFTKTVTTTVSYYVVPQYYVGTRSYNGTYFDFQANPTWIPSNNVSFVSVQGQGASLGTGQGFDATQDLVYQFSQSQSGWTGLFCFLAIIVICVLAAVSGGLGLAALGAQVNLGAVATGAAAVGVVAGLIATGGSPTTGTTANITPFFDSSYKLSPASNFTGDQQTIQQNTDSQWLNVDMASTPGGFQTVVTSLDLRKALACGGPSGSCVTPVVAEVGMGDPRFQQTINSMFRQPTKILENNTYPYSVE